MIVQKVRVEPQAVAEHDGELVRVGDGRAEVADAQPPAVGGVGEAVGAGSEVGRGGVLADLRSLAAWLAGASPARTAGSRPSAVPLNAIVHIAGNPSPRLRPSLADQLMPAVRSDATPRDGPRKRWVRILAKLLDFGNGNGRRFRSRPLSGGTAGIFGLDDFPLGGKPPITASLRSRCGPTAGSTSCPPSALIGDGEGPPRTRPGELPPRLDQP